MAKKIKGGMNGVKLAARLMADADLKEAYDQEFYLWFVSEGRGYGNDFWRRFNTYADELVRRKVNAK